jgi:hypothetical protein
MMCYFFAVYADADPTKSLTVMNDDAMTMAKRAAAILLLSIMFDDNDNATFLRSMKENSAVKQLTYLSGTLLLTCNYSMTHYY